MSALAVLDAIPMARPKRRINVDIELDLHQWLAEERRRDRLATTERMRALLELARRDPELRRRVLEMAVQLDEEDAARAETD